MNANGFGTFVPFGEIPPGTLFLDHSPGGVNETAILFKVVDPEGRHNAVRVFDRAVTMKGLQTPALSTPIASDHHVIALEDFVLEIENAIDNILWESDAGFVRAAVVADGGGRLSLKAYRNRQRDDYECLLFDLETGAVTDLAAASVGFCRWSIVRRGHHGERAELYRFEV